MGLGVNFVTGEKLSTEERVLDGFLAAFAAVQFIRGPKHLDELGDLAKTGIQLSKRLEAVEKYPDNGPVGSLQKAIERHADPSMPRAGSPTRRK